ncbi:hypothetical protein AAVH_17380 [Aphelenchoides avenae]|nr:hypothetical protein AAVH_17380 [Aphelenchus avenae]
MNKLFVFGLVFFVGYVLSADNSVESGSDENAGITIRPRRHSGFGSENGGRFGNDRFGQGNGFAEGHFGSGNSFGRGQFGGSDRGFGGNDKNDRYGRQGFGGNNFGGSRPGRFGSEGFGGHGSRSQFGGSQGFGQRL